MKTTAIIMAGGKGERFWPKSRKDLPKQFLSLTSDGKTMIQLTVERLLPLINYEDIYIVTNKNYINLVKQQLPQIPIDNILAEPIAKNTAPCIGLAAVAINKKYEDAIMVVLPSDHLIKSNQIFIHTIKNASTIALSGENLVTIGITPTYPETGYGYINFEANDNNGICNAYSVKKFVEKPNIDKAKQYLSEGTYLWNSGMFVWKMSTILNNYKKFLPDIYDGLMNIKQAFGTDHFDSVLYSEFEKFNSESIDFGVMEKAENIYTIPGNFGWDDVGSWLSLERINKTDEQGNSIIGDVIAIDTTNSIVYSQKKLVAAIGLKDIIIVDTDDALLICHKDNTQDVKKVIQNLKNSNRDDLL